MTTLEERRFASTANPLATLTGVARRSFTALSQEEARAVLQVRPDPVAGIRRPGHDPYHVLLFGGGVLRGVGLRDHELGLPGRVADELASRRSRGVQIDVVVEPRPTSPTALRGLEGLRLRRYDAVVVILGEPDSAHLGAAEWRGALVGLVRLLMSETAPGAGLFLYDSTRAGVPVAALSSAARIAASASRLIPVSEEVCGLTPRVRFGELSPAVLPADPLRGFADGDHRDWARWIVDRLEPVLFALDSCTDDDTPRRFRDQPQAERLRQRAVESLRQRVGDRDEQLDREVRQAKLMYRAEAAALTLVDGLTTWSRATTEDGTMVIDRSRSICDLGVRSDGLLLINDARRDPRTRDNPVVREASIGFYAGYPVHTWDGYRVGMVCVYGSAPRTFQPRDLDGLRDVAARVERVLWRKALQPR